MINALCKGALVAAVMSFAASSASAGSRPFTARDLATLDRASSPRLSPDGKTVAFSVRSTDWAANRGVSSIWTLDLTNPDAPPRRLAISDKEASAPHWSSDGKAIYFLSNRSDHRMQVWRTTPLGAEAVQITSAPSDIVAFKIAPDGKGLVIAVAGFADCPTLACSADRMKTRAADKAEGKVFDKLGVRFWDSFGDGRHNVLFAQPLDGHGIASTPAVALMQGLETDVPSKPEGDETSFVITPDGKAVIFAAHDPASAPGVDTHTLLYAAPMNGSAPARAISLAGPGSEAGPAISPDGKTLAYLGTKTSDFGAARVGVYVRPLAGGTSHEVDPGFDRSPNHLQWSDDGNALYATVEDMGVTRLIRIDARDGRVTSLTKLGHVSDYDIAGDRIVVARDALDSPADLFLVESYGRAELQLTHAHGVGTLAMSDYEPFTFPGWNGESVHGYVVRPYGYQPGHKYPVAFLIHGGPHGSFGDAWSYRWNPQVWAGMGYAVVMVDFHGSSGYGEAFGQSIVGHWGDRPLEDLQKGWGAALARYNWLDGDRACALGGSYGGYMVDWIAGNWNGPWKCLVDHDGILDTRLMAYATDIPGFSEAETGGLGWRHPEAVEQFNPINHLKDWSKPILVIHSGKDYRVPFDQGLGAFTAAQRKGVPSQFLYFDSENHWVLKPQNSVQWYAVLEAWMKRWIGDTGPKPITP